MTIQRTTCPKESQQKSLSERRRIQTTQLKGQENYRMPKIRDPNPKMERAASIIK